MVGSAQGELAVFKGVRGDTWRSPWLRCAGLGTLTCCCAGAFTAGTASRALLFAACSEGLIHVFDTKRASDAVAMSDGAAFRFAVRCPPPPAVRPPSVLQRCSRRTHGKRARAGADPYAAQLAC